MKNNKIKVVDSIMGSFKTTNAFKMINSSPAEVNYIYVTPYLDEVDRCKKMCKERRFYDPKHLGKGKLNHLHNLLLGKKDIATTHALFKMATPETYKLLKANNYILILDEVMGVIDQVGISPYDLKDLKENYLDIDDFGHAKWKEDAVDYYGKFKEYKNMADNDNLIVIDDEILIWSFPAKIFQSFKDVYILTYMFEAQIQKYYFDRYDIEYDYYYSSKNGYHKNDNGHTDRQRVQEISSHINIYDGHLNDIADDYYTLSKNWHIKNKDGVLMEQLGNNIYNYFRHIIGTNSSDNMWTTFKDFKDDLKGSGYTKGFVPLNARATNAYSEKKTLAYCVNVFLSPIITKYFKKYDIDIDEEKYALSEFIQWIWRSQIRNNKDIDIYIPSIRMRRLLINYLEGKNSVILQK